MADTLIGGILEEGFMLLLPILIILFSFIPGLILTDNYEKDVYFAEMEKLLVLHQDSVIELKFPYEITENVVKGNAIELRDEEYNAIVITPNQIVYSVDGISEVSHEFLIPNPYEEIAFDSDTKTLIITT